MTPANTYRLPCYACNGEGGKRTIIPHPGEAIAADIWEDICAECDGTGECDELICSGCDAPIPDDGECENCADADELTVEQWEAKHGAAVSAALAPRRVA